MKTRHLALILALGLGLAPRLAAGAPNEWRRDVGSAFSAARASGKPLLVDLYADWCGWCKVLERRVFPDPVFQAYAKDFVLLRVDVEDGGEGGELAARYDSSALPTLLYLEPSGALVGEVQGFFEARDLVQRLKNERLVQEKRIEGYERGLAAGDADFLRLSGIEFYRRRDGARAAALFARLLDVEKLDGEDEAWTRYFLADSLRQAQRFDEARAETDRARRAAAGSHDAELVERLDLLPFWISRDAHRCADASGFLVVFERQHPSSVLLPGARNAFDRLRDGAESCG